MKNPFVPLLLASTALTCGLFALFQSIAPLIPCTDPTGQSLGLALCVGLGFQLLAGMWRLGKRALWLLGVEAALLLLTVWLGFYPVSPLFAGGRIPVLQGFNVMTRARGTVKIAPGGVVTLGSGSPAEVRALTLVTDLRCTWMSTRGGALDDPQSCVTDYVPPQSEYDILKVSLQPGCGLPRSVGQVKISILPP